MKYLIKNGIPIMENPSKKTIKLNEDCTVIEVDGKIKNWHNKNEEELSGLQ